jgi:hypothetical protein
MISSQLGHCPIGRIDPVLVACAGADDDTGVAGIAPANRARLGL